jgi:hypothetical protein
MIPEAARCPACADQQRQERIGFVSVDNQRLRMPHQPSTDAVTAIASTWCRSLRTARWKIAKLATPSAEFRAMPDGRMPSYLSSLAY